jgi:hypothetical protein
MRRRPANRARAPRHIFRIRQNKRRFAMAGKPRKWSQHVTETSDALDLKPGVFKEKDPKQIARSLKASAEHSARRKSDPYRSAMSMLTFYINRAGDTLPKTQRKRLENAKDELRALYDKPAREKK